MSRFSAALCLALVGGAGGAQPFGRFGYSRFPDLPGVRLDLGGASIDVPGTDRIGWENPLPDWVPVAVSDLGATYFHAKKNPGGPMKTRVDLTAPGFAGYFAEGMRFRVRSISAPYLSWTEGSVSQDVPSPRVDWLVLSFRDGQPAWVIGFDRPTGLSLTGRAGDWRIEAEEGFSGWVRFAPLRGTRPALANTAGTLGRLSKEAVEHAPCWRATAPILTKRTEWAGPKTVAVRYEFDRPGAIVPAWLTMAPYAGLRPAVEGERVALPGSTEEGPRERLDGTTLAVRFAAVEMPAGRAFGKGGPEGGAASVSGFDLPGIVRTAFGLFDARTGPDGFAAATAARDEYLGGAPNVKEPFTASPLPFAENGDGADLAAAQALLQSATATARGTTEGPGPLAISLGWRRDWASGRFASASEAVATRTGSLAALAGLVSRDPVARVEGALWEVGVVAARGLRRWRARSGPAVADLAEPMPELRWALTGGPATPESRFLLSPARVTDGPSIFVREDGTLVWTSPEGKGGGFLLSSAMAGLEPVANLAELKLSPLPAAIDVTFLPTVAGESIARPTGPSDFADRVLIEFTESIPARRV